MVATIINTASKQKVKPDQVHPFRSKRTVSSGMSIGEAKREYMKLKGLTDETDEDDD